MYLFISVDSLESILFKKKKPRALEHYLKDEIFLLEDTFLAHVFF